MNRRSYNAAQAEWERTHLPHLQALYGSRDVTQELLAADPARSEAEQYAAAECAEGRERMAQQDSQRRRRR